MNKSIWKTVKFLRKGMYIPSNDSRKLNPKFLFEGVYKDLLVAVVRYQMDVFEIACQELRRRGLNNRGNLKGVKSKRIQLFTAFTN
jgi:hypothetical protein